MYGAQHLALASLAATFATAQYSAESSPVTVLSITATYDPAYTVTNEYDRTITSACPTSSAMNYTLSGVIFSSSNIRTLDGENCAYEGTQTNSVIFQSTPGPDATTRFGPNPGPEPTTTITPLAIPTSLPSAYGDIPPASARITTVTPLGGPPNTYTLVDCQALSAAPGRNISAYRYTAPGGQVAYAPQIFNDGEGSCAFVPTPTYSYTGTGPIQSRITVQTTGANSTVANGPSSTPEPYVGAASSAQMTGGMLGLCGAAVLAVAVML
ncbi:hypothetical protein KC340_g5320 [Hortaea werneckii]|nr:hypothetical protein KC342_g5630 [Hortaea werneckii]KAI7100332.1 hypothetical protein KC339_g7557 [Hortaea werneckii]KAI7242450.1 hypothetical protein KC365_g3155 [Hortaea werneckii]KAI7328015.1 hypothetical protein KC340_g5320 [Hortaea werneckii]KAI7376830.1 hypothetical protein KC328_g14722 [Hortaea werneckii]